MFLKGNIPKNASKPLKFGNPSDGGDKKFNCCYFSGALMLRCNDNASTCRLRPQTSDLVSTLMSAAIKSKGLASA